VKILLAVDGSKYGKREVDYLARHFESMGNAPSIELLHVQPPLPPHAVSHLPRANVQGYYKETSAKALAPAVRALAKAGITCGEGFVVGDPAAEIAATAEKGKFDMVVMGSHGHGLFTSLALGSVVTKVLAGCKVPVLIIR